MDLGQRAREILNQSDLIIGEEAKPLRRRLREWGIPLKPIECLNEHSRPSDIQGLLQLCLEHPMVALVSDCGTPGFCDPGAQLVSLCRQANVPVYSVPGPSSLMAFLSVCGVPLKEFYFRGFLPAHSESRQRALGDLKKIKVPIIIMDTPYRLIKTLKDMDKLWPQRPLTLGLDLSREDEVILHGKASQLLKGLPREKAEFILLVE